MAEATQSGRRAGPIPLRALGPLPDGAAPRRGYSSPGGHSVLSNADGVPVALGMTVDKKPAPADHFVPFTKTTRETVQNPSVYHAERASNPAV